MKLIGQSSAFQEVLRTADLVAATNVPVFISGDTGTGKSLLAQRIHQQSAHQQKGFIKLNCFSESIESQLFSPKKGALIQGRTNTLFLDEISALPEALQLKLLYLLEKDQHGMRLIVASHKNLYNEVEAGRFNAQLFYRLNVIPIELPRLKDRQDDIKLLVDYFLRRLVAQHHQAMPSFSKAALKKLSQYPWPGNIRELQNVCERLFLLCGNKELGINNLPQEIRQYSSSTSPDSPFSLPEKGIKLDSVEVNLMLQALDHSEGNKSKAARLLGLTRDTFLYRLKKYSIKA